MAYHDGWIQGCKVKGCYWDVVEAHLGIKHVCSLIGLVVVAKTSLLNRKNHVGVLKSLEYLGLDLDLLASVEQIAYGNACYLGHFGIVIKTLEFVNKFHWQLSILKTV